MSEVVRKNLGGVTAYAYAKSKGYTGTEDEFAQLMANYATVGQAAEEAAEQAIAAEINAESAAQTATTKASEASTSATSAAASASAASTSETSATASATAASGSATAAANSASVAQAAQAAAERVADSIPEDYSELSADVSGLKNELGEPQTLVQLPLAYIDGGYIKSNDGQVAEYSTWHYTDYIDVVSENVLSFIYVTGTIESVGSVEYNAFYSADKAFVSSFSCTSGKVPIPSNAKYVRLSYPKAPEFVQTLGIYNTTFRGEFEESKSNIFDDSFYVKAQLEFEAGGVSITTGQDYDGDEQKNRLRSRVAFAEKDYELFQSAPISDGITFIWYKVFYWDTPDTSVTPSRISDWYRFPDTPSYVITKGAYFRVLIYSEQYTSPITDVKSSFVYQHFDIEVAINSVLNESGIIALNRDVLPFVQSLPTSYPENAKTYFSATHVPLSFAHFSDIHNVPELWKRIVEYVDRYGTYLPFALHTGDYVGDDQTSYTDLYNFYMPSVPFYNCVGNHDTYANAQHTLATKQSVYEKLFNHTSNWNVTFMSGDYSMTYYKDFVDSNIRLIVFDNYYDINTQKVWLANILDDARTNGLHVITASHQVTGRPQTRINCTFESIIPYETAGSGSLLNTEFDAVIGTFISNGGIHIVHLCGHEHADFLYRTTNNVLNCAVACATDYTGWTEGARVPHTKSWDCFNAISADTDLGVLKIVRIGQNVDCFNRVKNTLSYDYINGNVLNND